MNVEMMDALDLQLFQFFLRLIVRLLSNMLVCLTLLAKIKKK